MTDFFNPTLAKLTFSFLQYRHSLSFQAIFSRPSQHRNLWTLDRFPLRRDLVVVMALNGARRYFAEILNDC